MFISRVYSKGKDGRQYVSVLLRQSTRVGKSVVSKTLAVLTGLPDWLLATVEHAVKLGKDAESIAQLAAASNAKLRLRCAESFGAVFLVHEVAKACGIARALGGCNDARLALWQVCARVLAPRISLLGMVRLAGKCAAPALLGFKVPFNEDDLYANGKWLAPRQAKIEAKLWRENPLSDGGANSLFLYDVTSSYFEGEHNFFARFGYNRDKTTGKRQLVMGLLTDATGEPLSVSLFPGNTSDLNTFSTRTREPQSHLRPGTHHDGGGSRHDPQTPATRRQRGRLPLYQRAPQGRNPNPPQERGNPDGLIRRGPS
jgi:hypothetical protein